jgi:hypothetical protein
MTFTFELEGTKQRFHTSFYLGIDVSGDLNCGSFIEAKYEKAKHLMCLTKGIIQNRSSPLKRLG